MLLGPSWCMSVALFGISPTLTRVSPANFDNINVFFQNSIVAILDTKIFIADLITYAATPPN
jgi:hypothetical protein